MKTISYKLKDLDQKEKKVTLKLGYVGENEHVQIRIDCSEIWENYPNAVASLAVEPPEGSKYPAIVTREGNIVCWTVKDSDLVHDGDGRIQLTFTEGSEIQKTVICRTKVDESIIGSGTAPDPIADFVAEANQALAELEAAEVHGPVIGEDGYWYTWSKDAGEYVKTDTKAEGGEGPQGPAGKDGKDGKDGADGAPGQDGHTPVKGTDYWTQQDQADIVAAAALETVSAVIDDTAGSGDTNKVWSADKSADVAGRLTNAIDGIIEYKNDALPFFQGGLNGTSGQDYSEAATAYAKTDFIRNVSKVTAISGYTLKIFYYTAQRSFISRESISDREWNIEDAPSNTAYIRVQIERSKGVDIGNIHNIVSVYQTDKTYKEAVKSIEECNPVGVREYSYKGEKITLTHKLSSEIFGSKIGISSCQDGVIIGNEMILFNDNGDFVSIDCTTKAKLGGGKLQEVITGVYPHANSASAGSEDNVAGYKYIYVNAYNNAGLPKGTCYVYSISKSGETYTASIVQTISIGFVTETIWDDGASVRPYGNFVVDVDNNALYAFTVQSATVTRFFKFNLPSLSLSTVTLTQADIIDQFDVNGENFQYPQGCTYSNGKIYALSGFSGSGCLHVIDLERKKEVTTINLSTIGIENEPEFISEYNGTLIVDNYANLMKLKF